MPELPEVETIVRQLDAALAGRTLGEVRLHRYDTVRCAPRPLGELLRRRRVERVVRRAKRIIIVLAPPGHLIVHLGMTGRFTLDDATDPAPKHTHLRIRIAGSVQELRFTDARRFGGVWWSDTFPEPQRRSLPDAAQARIWRTPVGPEPLSLTLAEFRIILRRRRPVKTLLMDQAAIAGLGNIYCSESLHRAGIHPETPACLLDHDAAGRLLRAIKTTLRQAIRHQGSTVDDYRGADGREGSYQNHHRVYQRERTPCPTCGAAIRRIVMAGRSTFYCPACQPRRRRKHTGRSNGG
ncbi:MAG: bifunctional DNA-formamidopyrimidine glycosylase/DNA-(apurinic or apyrimidinic site) lyase [Planctomycetes bacterium]|nr:bifunctional DNA-formamidopyrimidine glycosylase/DNA-(apurinic or apyrimidinic site) lyase [Planctomycetota bacterium]